MIGIDARYFMGTEGCEMVFEMLAESIESWRDYVKRSISLRDDHILDRLLDDSLPEGPLSLEDYD